MSTRTLQILGVLSWLARAATFIEKKATQTAWSGGTIQIACSKSHWIGPLQLLPVTMTFYSPNMVGFSSSMSCLVQLLIHFSRFSSAKLLLGSIYFHGLNITSVPQNFCTGTQVLQGYLPRQTCWMGRVMQKGVPSQGLVEASAGS